MLEAMTGLEVVLGPEHPIFFVGFRQHVFCVVMYDYFGTGRSSGQPLQGWLGCVTKFTESVFGFVVEGIISGIFFSGAGISEYHFIKMYAIVDKAIQHCRRITTTGKFQSNVVVAISDLLGSQAI